MTATTAAPHTRSASGLGWGFVGVLAFSFTLPLTRVADRGMSPLFLGSARAVIASLLAVGALSLTRQRLPSGTQWARLAVVAGGIVLGFPLLTSFALKTVPAGHGAVVIAVLPAATAVGVVLRTKERPLVTFWLAAALGTAAAVGFAVIQAGGLKDLQGADAVLFGAVVTGAAGYTEGGTLARELGPWQTVSWALVVSSPIMVILTVVAWHHQAPHATASQWLSLAYLGGISAYLGFFAWYHGLAIGEMARVSQVQLIQPVLSLIWAWLLLGESITATTILGGLIVIGCAASATCSRSLK